MITNGMITEALNPENEGLSVRAVLTREVEGLYKLINSLNNVYEDRINTMAALAAGEDTEMNRAELLTLLSGSDLLQKVAYYLQNRGMLINLADCGVAANLSNLDAVLTPVFGSETAIARQNILNVVTVIGVLTNAVTMARLSPLVAALSELKDAVRVAKSTMNIPTGV